MSASCMSHDILLTILIHLDWEDLRYFLSDGLFNTYHAILSSRSFLLLLCQRDFCLAQFDDLPHLSIPMQMYCQSYMISKLHTYSFSSFICQCGLLTNQLLSKIFCFEELIRIFRVDHHDSMKIAFYNSKAVRLAFVKTILSHPLSIFWNFQNNNNPSNIVSTKEISRDYRSNTAMEYLEENSNNEFVKNWQLHIDYMWHSRDGEMCMLFMDNVNNTNKCGIFIAEIQFDNHCGNDRIMFDNFMLFDENTSLDDFKNLYRTSLSHYFNFVYLYWPKFQIDECLQSKDQYIIATLNFKFKIPNNLQILLGLRVLSV
eukprot:262392_1